MLVAGVFVIAYLAKGPLSLSATGAGAAAGAAYAVTLATGRYDDLVGELYRIATDA